ncbi:UNVERIFIED_CONTAM: hypothetical protein Sradi_2964500 [Sesamum radiatum]|uniref:Uncharacterized protein n=1 Tax=Sesamum radiatum TaxID=300843 RepID=A0AAW2S0R7_SESRA
MNFLMLRSNNQTATPELQSVKETQVEADYVSKVATTLEGLIVEDLYKGSTSSETCNAESDESRDENGSAAVSSGKNNSQVDTHADVTEADGIIIIPYSMTSCLLVIDCIIVI